MKQKIFYLIALCLLSLTSCTQDNELETTREELSDEYVTLSLDLSSGSNEKEEARVFHYAGSGSQNVSTFFGKDGDKIPMRVALFKYPQGTERAIYTGVLDWTIENNGRRARYKGKLKVLRDKLANAGNRFYMYVAPDNTHLNQGRVKITPIMTLPESRSTARNLEESFFAMQAPLVREGNTLKNDWENITHPRAEHKFLPYIAFVQVSIQNNRSYDMYLSMAVLQDQGNGIVLSHNTPGYLYGLPAYTNEHEFHNDRYYLLKTENETPIRIPARNTTKVFFLAPNYDDQLMEMEFIRGSLSGTKEYLPLFQISIPPSVPNNFRERGLFYSYGIALN